MDEFKILLPAICMPNMHVLFTFRSVYHEEKGDAKKNQLSDNPVGYAWIKLFENNKFFLIKLSIIESGEYSLPVLTSIPNNYLSVNLEKIEKTKGAADLKYIDSNGKPVFKFNLNFHTNYHSFVFFLLKEPSFL